MKVFKWIYYPVMIVLVVLMTVFGCLGVRSGESKSLLSAESRVKVDDHIKSITGNGTHNAAFEGNLTDVADYIRAQVRTGDYVKYRSTDRPDSDGLNTSTRYVTQAKDGKDLPCPTYVAQDAKLLPSTVAQMDGGLIYVDREVTNLVIAVPGADTIAKYADRENEALAYGDVVMYTAHYDTSTLSEGAANNTAAVANMIEVIKNVASRETPYKNDLLFVFTAGGEENALGAYAFKYQFKGFDDIFSRVKVAFDFDAVGGSGALIMSEVTDKGDALVSAYAKVAGKTYTDSIYSSLYAGSDIDDFDAFSDVAGMRFATASDSEAGTQFDTADNLDEKLVTSYGNMMLRAADYFGDADLNAYAAGGRSHGFFNYLGATISYPDYVAYIFGALIVIFAALGVFFSIRFKTFGTTKVLFGALVQLLATAATLVVAYAAYFIIALILSAAQVVNVHAMALATLSNPGITLFAIVLAFALSVAFYPALKKIFAVRAADVVRGNTLLFALVSVIFCFAAPTAAYLFFPVATLWTLIYMLTAIFKDKFRKRFGMSIDRLFLYAIPAALMLPVLFGTLSLMLTAAPLVMLPLFIALLFVFAGGIMPFADYLVRPLGALFAAMPGMTVREKQTYTVKEEDAAKKGKFNEVQKTRVVKNKEKLVYHNAVGISVVSIVSTIAICLFAAYSGGFGRGVTSAYSFYDEVYKDSLVYVWDDGVETIQVRDLEAYKYIARYIDGFEWDGEKNAYVRSSATSSLNVPVKPSVSVVGDDRNKFEVLFNDSGDIVGGAVTVTLGDFGSGNFDSVKFVTAAGREWEYDLTDRQADNYTFVLPFDYASGFTVEVQGNAQRVSIDVEQRGGNTQLANNHALFSLLQEAYSTDKNVTGLTMSIIMHTKKTFDL